jgi:hypothetical protein
MALHVTVGEAAEVAAAELERRAFVLKRREQALLQRENRQTNQGRRQVEWV